MNSLVEALVDVGKATVVETRDYLLAPAKLAAELRQARHPRAAFATAAIEGVVPAGTVALALATGENPVGSAIAVGMLVYWLLECPLADMLRPSRRQLNTVDLNTRAPRLIPVSELLAPHKI